MDIAEILALKTWAVVGLTDHPHRPAHGVARFLMNHGRQVIPVNPTGATVHGEVGYPTLADIPVPVDVVDIFRRSSDAGAHVDEAIAIGAKAVWLQLGVIDEAAAARARAAGLAVVMDRCPAIEWRAHGPRP
ncbi:CoA-binding protein [Longispora fulva]|uniref:Putative CoA-binding protein n=1 Tax=Longispora fulva TaxID=619741 RepID=A0A8J7GQ82_9ACTN|nr:CoA-binding protein [Longispora fulva]MBG6134911.1 putative CoA-binding protein [Longispora fulva]GIG56857.1 CoA-binding protein [Longispora fulva]